MEYLILLALFLFLFRADYLPGRKERGKRVNVVYGALALTSLALLLAHPLAGRIPPLITMIRWLMQGG